MALGSTCDTKVNRWKLVLKYFYPGDVQLADVRSLGYLGCSGGNIIPILLSGLSPSNDGSEQTQRSQYLLARPEPEIPALTTAVFTLSTGRRGVSHVSHVCHLLLHLLILGFLVDLVNGLGAGIFSPFDPIVLS